MDGIKIILAILGVICCHRTFAHDLADLSDRLIFPGEVNIPEQSSPQKSTIASRQTTGSISDLVISQQSQQQDQINKYLSGGFPTPNSPQKPDEPSIFTHPQTIKDRYDAEQQRLQEEHRIRVQQQEDFQRQQAQQQYFPQQVEQKSPTVQMGTENYIDPLNFQLPHTPNRITQRPHQPSESDAITAFAWRLFKGIKPPNRHTNIIVSPLLTQLSLSLLESGAEGYSREQIQEAVQTSPEFLAHVVRSLKNTQPSTSLEYSAALFVSNYLKLNGSFAQRAKQAGSDTVPVDFPNQSSAIKQINTWIGQATRNYIPNFLDSSTPTQGIDMLIANAVFFKSIWRHPFNETFKGDFFYKDGRQGQVNYMRVAKHMRTGAVELGGPSGGLKWVEIPYAGGEFSMILIVPRAQNTLEDLIRVLTPNHLSGIMDDLEYSMTHIVKLQMPKFQLKSRVSLTKSLLEMGVSNIFTSQSNLPYVALNVPVVRVTDCIQHAVLNVDELGTVATAVNTFSVITLSISVPDPEISFVVNEPFLALIVDKRQKVPLFITKIYNP
uniref:Putative serine protease inhibitor serpin n=1 Tax=Phlebotomus kandelakii TaxID=1109342 RepID=A0A6B2EG29_9DIPT